MRTNFLSLIMLGCVCVAIHAEDSSAIFWPGTVQPWRSTDLYGKDIAYVTAVLHDIGDHVAKGELLGRLENPELISRWDQAKSQLLQAQAHVQVAQGQVGAAEAEVKLKEVSLNRIKNLVGSEAATAQSLDEAQAGRDVATAHLDQSRAEEYAAQKAVEVAMAEVSRIDQLLSYDAIRAPYSGVITRRWVNIGDLVTAAGGLHSTPLWNIQEQDRLRIVCYVPEKDIDFVHRGAIVQIEGPHGLKRQARISRSSRRINENNRGIRIEIDLPNVDHFLVVGSYVRVIPTMKTPKM